MGKKKKKILVTGCFDIIHPGHLFLIRQAAKRGEVYVIVARDSTTQTHKKEAPIVPEAQRLEVVRGLQHVKKAVLGNEGKNFMKKALSLDPDVILLGPNQRISTNNLYKLLESYGASDVEVERLDEMYDKFELNSSSAIKRKIKKEFQENNK